MIPRKGAEVAEITEKNLRDVLEVREALEVLAVQLACEKMNEEQVERLKIASKEFEETLTENDITRIAEADVRFHDVVYEATENKRLVQLLNNLREQMYRYRVEYLKRETVRRTVVDEHEELIQAIIDRNKDAAATNICKHIENQVAEVARTIVEKE